MQNASNCATETVNNWAHSHALRLYSYRELTLLPSPRWLVTGVLPSVGSSVVYGAPGTAKTFIALDLALSIATGREWHGRETEQGEVVYVAAEGESGLQFRCGAWLEANGVEEEPAIHFVPEPVQLAQAAPVEALIATIRQRGVEPKLIVIDTLSRCFAGQDENNASAMSLLVQAADRIGASFGAAMLLVHHSRKEDRQERGSSALRAGTGMMASVTMKDNTNEVIIECTRMKEAVQFDNINLRLVRFENSCVLKQIDGPLLKSPRGSGAPRRVWECLDVVSPNGTTGAEWRRRSEIRGVKGSTYDRAKKYLVDHGFVIPDGDRFTVTEKGNAVIITNVPSLREGHGGGDDAASALVRGPEGMLRHAGMANRGLN